MRQHRFSKFNSLTFSLTLWATMLLVLLSACSSSFCPHRNAYNKHIAAYPVSSTFVTTSDIPSAAKVLFIGNSILYWHDIPRIFSFLMTQVEPLQPTKIAYVVGNNYSLKDHWDASTALDYIRKKGPWDYVVIQDSTNSEFYDYQGERQCLRIHSSFLLASGMRTN